MKKSHHRKKVVKVSSRNTSHKTIKKTSKRNRVISSRNRFFKQEIYTGPLQAPPIPQKPRFPLHGYAPSVPQRPPGYVPPLPQRPQMAPQRPQLAPQMAPQRPQLAPQMAPQRPQLAPQMAPQLAAPRSRGFFSNLYNKYSKKGRIKDTAYQVLSSTDQNEFSEKCNNLFQVGASKEVYNQYQMMKAKRPQAEVNNLCGNFAKTLL
jgi:hypothetical protein